MSDLPPSSESQTPEAALAEAIADIDDVADGSVADRVKENLAKNPQATLESLLLGSALSGMTLTADSALDVLNKIRTGTDVGHLDHALSDIHTDINNIGGGVDWSSLTYAIETAGAASSSTVNGSGYVFAIIPEDYEGSGNGVTTGLDIDGSEFIPDIKTSAGGEGGAVPLGGVYFGSSFTVSENQNNVSVHAVYGLE